MARGRGKIRKSSAKAAAPRKGQKQLSDFEREMAERAAALIAAGKMPAFEDVLRAVKKIRENEVAESLTREDGEE